MGVGRGTWKDLKNAEAGRSYKEAGLWESDYESLSCWIFFFFLFSKIKCIGLFKAVSNKRAFLYPQTFLYEIDVFPLAP